METAAVAGVRTSDDDRVSRAHARTQLRERNAMYISGERSVKVAAGRRCRRCSVPNRASARPSNINNTPVERAVIAGAVPNDFCLSIRAPRTGVTFAQNPCVAVRADRCDLLLYQPDIFLLVRGKRRKQKM